MPVGRGEAWARRRAKRRSWARCELASRGRAAAREACGLAACECTLLCSDRRLPQRNGQQAEGTASKTSKARIRTAPQCHQIPSRKSEFLCEVAFVPLELALPQPLPSRRGVAFGPWLVADQQFAGATCLAAPWRRHHGRLRDELRILPARRQRVELIAAFTDRPRRAGERRCSRQRNVAGRHRRRVGRAGRRRARPKGPEKPVRTPAHPGA